MLGVDRSYRAWLLASLAFLLAACGSVRPTAPPDAMECGLQRFVVADMFSEWGVYRSKQLQTLGLDAPRPSFNVLALSAGGQFGAYGAGFLTGWGSVGPTAKPSPRKDIQVVTGVSTGAILATHAFLEMDEEIEARYRASSGPSIYKKRNVLALLTANSLLDDSGKERLIADNLSSALIDRVAAAPDGRFLYLGVVDLDSGRFLRIDMVKLARTVQPIEARDRCYRAVVGASSAIPIAFPPKFVDDMMLTDGGARRHLFVTDPPAEAKKPGVDRRLFSLVHGDLDVGCQKVENGVIPIASRSADLFSDQSFKDSIRLGDLLAQSPVAPGQKEPLFRTFYASAARAAKQCEPKLAQCAEASGTLSEDLFCQPFMICLADQGRADGKAYGQGVQPWLTLADLNLSSETDCSRSIVQRRAGQ
ncbi:MAG: patatin-like phospholipase family protein [Burkholderiales bacterium]|nr:patatin-like phospholipase family protein [Burkholderiales bacterium]